MRRMLEIAFKRGGVEFMRQPIGDSPLTIGRSPDNAIRLLEPEISRNHCRIEWREGALVVTDISTNGTLVNGLLHKEAKIDAGDSLAIGPWTLSIESVTDAVPIKTIARSPATKVIQYDSESQTLTTEGIEITVRSPDQASLIKRISSSEITIGQHASCDIAIADPYVSRRHCKIANQGGAMKLVDLGSTNGTYVGDVRVSETLIPQNSSFRIGRSTVSLRAIRSSEKIAASKNDRLGRMIGPSRAMRELFALIERVGPSDAAVCITGESGTGKELAAREIHDLSARRRGPFVAINCGALPPSIVEGQLFGHERGAFTGAVERMPGLIEQAKGGTLFLDEIGEMPPDLQTRLLRAIETRCVRRIGGQEDVPVDFRLVCATNCDLKRRVAEGRFREDLFFRIFVVPIDIPPLRARPEDTRALAGHFVGELSKNGKRRTLSEQAVERLLSHEWPGNVRELRNTLERTLILTDRDEIDAGDLRIEPLPKTRGQSNALRENERSFIADALSECGGNLSRASKKLGIARTTLQKKIKRLAINVPRQFAANAPSDTPSGDKS